MRWKQDLISLGGQNRPVFESIGAWPGRANVDNVSSVWAARIDEILISLGPWAGQANGNEICFVLEPKTGQILISLRPEAG